MRRQPLNEAAVHKTNGKAPEWLVEIRRANGDARRMVERLFLRALATLGALPDRDVRYFRVTTAWPLCPRDWHAYSDDPDDEPETRFTPTPRDHDRMLDVLAWGSALDRLQWSIVRDIASGYSDAMIADRV